MMLGHRLQRPAGRRGLARPALRPSQLQRTREYVAVVRMALARERLEYDGETLELPLPDGPGKALKLTIGPVQERIPIYLAAIGPKNTALAAEIADGWMPTLFSPEHVGEFRPLLEEGFARAGDGKGFDDFDIAPDASTCSIADDLESARDAMRPLRRALRRRHGLAQEELLQPARAALRLRGRGARGPGPLPRGQEGRGRGGAARRADRRGGAVRARPTSCASGSASTATPGVGTLIVSPMAWTLEDRLAQLRHVAELGLLEGLPRRLRRPRPRLPDARARDARWSARGHEVALRDLEALAADAEAAGMHFAAAPEYQVFPTRRPSR